MFSTLRRAERGDGLATFTRHGVTLALENDLLDKPRIAATAISILLVTLGCNGLVEASVPRKHAEITLRETNERLHDRDVLVRVAGHRYEVATCLPGAIRGCRRPSWDTEAR